MRSFSNKLTDDIIRFFLQRFPHMESVNNPALNENQTKQKKSQSYLFPLFVSFDDFITFSRFNYLTLFNILTDWLNVSKSCKYGLLSEKEKYCLSCNNYDKIRNESEISKICNKLLCFFVSSFLTFHDMLRWFFTYGGGGIDIKCFATIMQIGVTLLYPWGRGSFGETIERANGWCFGCR